MEAQKLEDEFSVYWQKLTIVQKESIFYVVKNFADANEGAQDEAIIPKEVMDDIWKNREDYAKGTGKNYTREEARAYVLGNQAK